MAKKTVAKKPAKPSIPTSAVESIILMLVSNLSQDQISKNASAIGLRPEQVDAAVKEARKKITLAADFHRDTELGTSHVRLNEIYRRTMAVHDMKTALAAQKELNKLLDLYQVTTGDDDAGGDGLTEKDKELEAIRAHLLPLGLAKPDYPLREHARIAAEQIRQRKG